MIQAIMLIALGFLAATLIGILLAPSLWSRAYRLSKKRLEATLPLSLSEIEAGRDQIRAVYAVRLRRLETALARAKQKTALQLVDNSRLQMRIITLNEAMAEAETKLAERQNAAAVLEQTLVRRMPELNLEIADRKADLAARVQEIQDLTNRISRREEALQAAQKASTSYEQELERLRAALEKTGADKGGRLLRRPSQWTLDDYRSEYDRLHLELSKMRQQIGSLQEKDVQQTSLIKGDLQKLAELVLASKDRGSGQEGRVAEGGALRRGMPSDLSRERPIPYPLTPSDYSQTPRQPVTPVRLPSPSPQVTPAGREGAVADAPKAMVAEEPASPSSRDGFATPTVAADGAPHGEKFDRPASLGAGTPKTATSRLSRDVTAKEATASRAPATRMDPAPDMARPGSYPVSLGPGKTNGGASAGGAGEANAERALADARHLKVLSELTGPVPEAERAKPTSAPVAEEARRSVVVDGVKDDLNGSPLTDRSQTRSAKLLERLRAAEGADASDK